MSHLQMFKHNFMSKLSQMYLSYGFDFWYSCLVLFENDLINFLVDLIYLVPISNFGIYPTFEPVNVESIGVSIHRCYP